MTKLKIGQLYEYDRDVDGVDMIAISSRARTLLGRGLAAGALLPSSHQIYGSFKSLAGFIRYVCGDRREHVREIVGVEYDDAILDKIPAQYEDVVQDHFVHVFTRGRAQELALHKSLHDNTLPFFLYQEVDGELIPVRAPAWFNEVLVRLMKRKPILEELTKGFQWDEKELHTPPATPEEARQRSLKELQAEYLRIHEGTDAQIDFLVSQAEYDSIPEPIRRAMGNALKIQAIFEGRHIPAPPKKIM